MEKSIRDLIARLPIPGLKESTDRHIIAGIISKTLSVPIRANQILFKDGTVTVTVPPVVKSALHIHNTRLIDECSKNGISITTIR